MAKAETQKPKKKPSKKDQYERFRRAARDLGVDDDASIEAFERTFEKIVPPKRAPKEARKDRG